MQERKQFGNEKYRIWSFELERKKKSQENQIVEQTIDRRK